MRTAQITMRIAPIVIAESATLNVGNRPTCTKSTTAPFEEARRPEDPVHEVADGAAEHQREPDDHHRVTGPAHRAHQQHRDDDGDDREQRRERLEQAERAPGVAGQREADVVADRR